MSKPKYKENMQGPDIIWILGYGFLIWFIFFRKEITAEKTGRKSNKKTGKNR